MVISNKANLKTLH